MDIINTIYLLSTLSASCLVVFKYFDNKKYLNTNKNSKNAKKRTRSVHNLCTLEKEYVELNIASTPTSSPVSSPSNKKQINMITPKPFLENPRKHYYYDELCKVIPKQSRSMNYLNELIKNNEMKLCCDPQCKRQLGEYIFCAFDGYYCTEYCRNNAIIHISHYWINV